MSTQQLDQKINAEKLIAKKAWQAPELTLRGQVKAVTSSNNWGGSSGGNHGKYGDLPNPGKHRGWD